MSSTHSDDRIKLSVKSSNYNIVSSFASTEDDTKLFFLANNCNVYNWNNSNSGAFFGAQLINIDQNNTHHEPYIGIQHFGDKKLAQFNDNFIKFNRDVIPNGTESLSLGTKDNRWKDLWVSGNTIGLGDLSLSSEGYEGGLAIEHNTIEENPDPENPRHKPSIQIGALVLKSPSGSTAVMSLSDDGKVGTKTTTPDGLPAPANTDINGDLLVTKLITSSNIHITSNALLQNLTIKNTSNNGPSFLIDHGQN